GYSYLSLSGVKMAAAAVGARRGRNRGQLIKAEQELARRAQENELKRQQNEVAKSIMEKYDSDNSGALSPKELKRMLRDYSQHRFKMEVQPSAEDLIFLFRLFDSKPDGVIDRDEVMSIVGAWGEFMKQKQLVQNLAMKFDKDADNQIDLVELQDILDATNKKPVKPEITQWVMREADVSGNGSLNHLELARALCTFELLSKGEPKLRKDLQAGIVIDDDLPTPAKSSFCTVQRVVLLLVRQQQQQWNFIKNTSLELESVAQSLAALHASRPGRACGTRDMGIKQLGKYLKTAAPDEMNRHRCANEYKGTTVAIDASPCLYQCLTAMGDTPAGAIPGSAEDTSHIAGLLRRTVRLLELGFKPIFVFDGDAPELKKAHVFLPNPLHRLALRYNESSMGFCAPCAILTLQAMSHDGLGRISEIEGTLGNDDGLDPMTKDMDIQEFHVHLQRTFGGDPEKLKEWYKSEGFLCGYPLLPGRKEPMSEEDAAASFLEVFGPLATRWAAIGLVSEASATSSQILANRDRWGAALVVIRYMDGKNGNCMWRNRWAKQARGTVLFANPEDISDVRVLNFKLPRGAEVKTFLHTERGVSETQDFVGNAYNHLDDWTIKTCDCLRMGGKIRGHLSFKGDGSLMTFTLVTGSAAELWQPILELWGSPWVRAWNDLCRNVCAEDGVSETLVLVPATNGVAMMDDFMVSYMTTGLLVGTGAASRDALLEVERRGGTAVDALWQHGAEFVRSLVRFRLGGAFALKETVTLSFEVMVAHLRGLFGDRYHSELAVSYDRDRAVFLGASCALQFYPHYCFEHPFEEPLYWPVSHSDDVAKMLTALEKLARTEISKEEFFADCPPASQTCEDAIIDYEGWVFHVSLGPWDENLEATPKESAPGTLYTKIKTPLYYRFHKVWKGPEGRAETLEVAPLVQQTFPKAKRLLEVFATGALQLRMEKIMDQVTRLFDFDDPENALLAHMRARDSGAKGSPLQGFGDRPYETQCKIAMNAKTSPFAEILMARFAEEFSFVKGEDRELKVALKGMVMKMQPWAPLLRGYDPTDPLFEPLVAACMRGA
ncbi:FEN1, partial [Symbiodinium microadriaticum]